MGNKCHFQAFRALFQTVYAALQPTESTQKIPIWYIGSTEANGLNIKQFKKFKYKLGVKKSIYLQNR